MIRVIILENPFEPRIKDIKEQVCTNMPITNYVETKSRDVFLNGRKLNDVENTIPQDNDEIISVPHISGGGGLGKILGFVASIALTVYCGSIASGLWGANAFWGAVEAGAVMYLGGRVVNSVFPQAVNFRDNQTSQTYGWDLPTVSTVEGGIIGRTYGTCIPQPQLLSEHVETVNGQQYLNLLYCGGYGAVDSIDNIRIDNTPISCFNGVQIETRLGTNTQLPISFFKDTPIDESVGLLLDLNKSLVRTTSSKKASALEVTFEFPSGLYHVADNGAYDTATVNIQVQYRKTGSQDWIFQNRYSVSNASSDGFRKAYKWNVSEAGQYDIQIMIVDKPTGSRYSTYCQWSMLTAYNSGIYSRPNKVLVGLRILATNQLSGGVPNVNWRQTRTKVYVYNPHAGVYETKAANNPIWAAYDILHGCEYIEDSNTHEFTYIVSGCKHDALDDYYDEWQAAANYADEMILNHDGVKEKRYQFDAFYDTEAKRYDAATKAAVVGHSNIIIHGSKYGIVTDKPSTVCQIFGEGRTKLSSVSGSFTSKDERAKAIEITYNDADNDYKNTQFTLRSDDFAKSNTQDNTAQLTLFGVSRRSQAYREAITALATNERQLQSIELSTDIDGITAEYGDVIGYSHAVSKIGIASGRIVSATATTVKLDKTVEISASKTYEIYVQLANDKLLKREVVPTTINTDTLTVTQPFDVEDIPQLHDCYSFGETDKAIKPFRIVGAERDGDLLCKLKLIEYDAAIYATELDYSKYPRIDYTNTTDNITQNVTASEETYMQRDGTVISNINIAWDMPPDNSMVTGYVVVIMENATGKTETITTTNTHCKYIGAIATHSYIIQVNAKIIGIAVAGSKTSIYITGKDNPPPDVTGLTAIVNPADRTQVTLNWQQVDAVDLNHYEVSINGSVAADTSANNIILTVGTDNASISVVAADNSGNISSSPATITAATVIYPSDVAGLSLNQRATDRSIIDITWTAVADTDLSHYEIREGDTWESGKIIDKVKSLNTSYQMPSSGYYRFWIAAVNAAGHYSVNKTMTDVQAKCEPDQPTSLAYVQDVRNAKRVMLTWIAAAGQDIAGYEISRNDIVVGFAADTAYTDTVGISGTYTYSIRTKTAGAFYSGNAYLTAAVMLEPLDVTGFKAMQQLKDKSVVRLTWDANSAGDLSHYEIREGAAWDTGMVVVDHAVGTYADISISEKKSYTWQIKAISSNGYSSLYPAIVAGIFSLNPTTVKEIQVKQAADDRSMLNIQWAGVDDKDLSGYQVKIGDIWESAESLPLTQELYAKYTLSNSGSYKIMVKTLNNSGFYSDESSIDYKAIVEPSDVLGLVAFQNGDSIELYWDKSADTDVIGYEIREGYSFDQSSLISTGVTNASITVNIDTMRLYRYHVKAINRSGHYSRIAASVSINVTSIAPRNIIDTFDEIALASGTHDNTEFGQSSLNFQTLGGRFSDYPTTKFSEVGGYSVLELTKQADGTYNSSGVYTAAIIDIDSIITCNVTALFTSSTMLEGGTATLQVRSSQDGVAWLEWVAFKPVQRTFRYIQFRVLLETNDKKRTPEVNQCLISIDVPDTDIALSATITAGGGLVTYGHIFYTIPYVTPCAVGEGLHAELISKDKASCLIKIKDKNNNDVGGTADVRIKGY